jgi:hypothetical protein
MTTTLPVRFVNAIKTLAEFSDDIDLDTLNTSGGTVPTFAGPLHGDGEVLFAGAFIDVRLAAVLRGETTDLDQFLVITGNDETTPYEIHVGSDLNRILRGLSSDGNFHWVRHTDLDAGTFGYAACKWVTEGETFKID